jgi:hypothetical protein
MATKITRKRNLIIASMLLVFAFASISSNLNAAKFYKWTDDEGSVHYSDKPNENNTAETIHISAPKASENAHPSKKTISTDKEGKENKTENMKRAESVEEYCETLRGNIKTLETKNRIQSVDAEGNKVDLNEASRQEKLSKYKEQLKSRCQ